MNTRLPFGIFTLPRRVRMLRVGMWLLLAANLVWWLLPRTETVAVADTPAPRTTTTPSASNPQNDADKPESLVGRTIADFSALQTDGTTFHFNQVKAKVTVVAFMGTQCPIAAQYFPRLVELDNAFDDASLAVIAINSNQQDSLPEVREQARRSGAKFAVLKDAGNKLAEQFRATRTPEIFVLDRDRKVRYHGRFDDQFGYQYRRQQPRQNYTMDAVRALVADKPVLVAETSVEGCFIGRRRQPRGKSAVTFHRDVLPILQNRCQECHRPGEIGPFALMNFDDASSWSETIREVVTERRMPPWTADPQHGKFSNDARLTDDELQTIVAWVDAGAPAGDPADAPAPKSWPEGWGIGTPDEVFTMPKPFNVPARGEVKYQHFTVGPVFTEDRWVQAVECRPGNRAVVHHVLALLLNPKDRKQSQNGLDKGFFAAAAPGHNVIRYPEGQAKKIPAGSQIVLQLHYTPNGTEQQDQSSIGVIYAKEPPRHEVRTYGLSKPKIRIPAGAEDHVETQSMIIPADVQITTLFPHMHLRGKSFEFRAIGLDQREQILLSVPRWDFNWQMHYRLQEPLLLKRGTRLVITAHWDNSEKNPNNILPPVDVTWGDQTWDEMFIGYMDYLVPVEKSRKP